MSPNKIKALLVERGIKQAQIAGKLGVKRPMISRVISGDANSRRVREAIAKAVDKSVSELWAA